MYIVARGYIVLPQISSESSHFTPRKTNNNIITFSELRKKKGTKRTLTGSNVVTPAAFLMENPYMDLVYIYIYI